MDPISWILGSLLDGGEAAASGIGSLGSSLGSAFGLGGDASAANALGTGAGATAGSAGSGAAAAATPATSQNWLDSIMGTDTATGKPNSFGKVLGALKSSPGAKPQFSGGFTGPSIPSAHQIQAPDLVQQLSSILNSRQHQTLGQLLAKSPVGFVRTA